MDQLWEEGQQLIEKKQKEKERYVLFCLACPFLPVVTQKILRKSLFLVSSCLILLVSREWDDTKRIQRDAAIQADKEDERRKGAFAATMRKVNHL